jgi:methyl-accepting chemotaxis protein
MTSRGAAIGARLRDTGIGTRLLLMASVLSGLTAVMAVLGLWGLGESEKSEKQVGQDANQTFQMIDAARSAQLHVSKAQLDLCTGCHLQNKTRLGGREMESFLRGEEESFGKSVAEAQAQLQKTRGAMIQQGMDVARLDAAISFHKEFGRKYSEAIKTFERSVPDAHAMIDRLVQDGADRALMEALQEVASGAQAHASTDFVAKEKQARDRNAALRNMMVVGLVVALVVSFGFSMVTIRSVQAPVAQAVAVTDQIAHGDLSARVEASGSNEMGRLLAAVGRMAENLRRTIGETKAGANALASAVAQISGSARRTVQAAQQQATAVQETTTSTAELAETVRVTGQRASEVQHAMDRTMETGQDIRGDLAEAQTVVSLVREEMRTIVSSIQGLVGRNQQIGEIIENVRDVADQTQLLAVNAGIEAAKAGEFGRGFSVVASEMKALADQSKKAAQRIREIVGEVQRATAESVRTVETGQERLQEALLPVGNIIPKVEQLTVQVEDSGQSLRQILAIVQQQTVGIDQINQAMKVVQEAVQESLVQNQELEAGSDSLGSLARQLDDAVAGYRF